MLKAVTRSAREVDQKVAAINAERSSRGQNAITVAYYFDHYGSDDDAQVMVTEEDFNRAKAELVPSVSLDELQHYERVRSTFEGAAKKEDKSNDGIAAPPTQNGSSDVLSQATEMMKRVNKIKIPSTNGFDHSRPNSASATAQDTDDDDYVIRTDRLALNQSPAKS